MFDIRHRNNPGLSRLVRTLLVLSTLLASVAASAISSTAQARECFSTALVFAIDASGSIDDREYVLQMTGLSNALRDPEVANAIQSAGGIALAAVVWSDMAVATSTVGWQTVRSAHDIDQFARTIESLPRIGGGGTDLGQGVWAALDLLDESSLCALRHVIDVSGDGRETLYPRRRNSASILSARKRAQDAGVIINGLAIVDQEADLEAYYLENVVTGPDSFVILVDRFEDFSNAMRTKILREITPVNQAHLNLDQPETSID